MNKIFAVALTVSCLTASVPAIAQPTLATSPLSPIYACADKTDPMQRLACFDAAVAVVKAAEARSDIITLDRPRVAAVRREAFGFRIPSLPRFGFGGGGSGGAAAAGAANSSSDQSARPSDDSEDEQNFVVTRVGRAGDRVAIYLDNGNVWQLTEAGEFSAPRQTPFNVRIRTASLGSFILSVEGRNKGYRVRRVQ